MKHKNILVTGGSGFIGTNLLKKLSFNSNYNLSSNYYGNNVFKRVDNVEYSYANPCENLDECKKILARTKILL